MNIDLFSKSNWLIQSFNLTLYLWRPLRSVSNKWFWIFGFFIQHSSKHFSESTITNDVITNTQSTCSRWNCKAELDHTDELRNIFWKTKLSNFHGKPQISAWLDFHGSFANSSILFSSGSISSTMVPSYVCYPISLLECCYQTCRGGM